MCGWGNFAGVRTNVFAIIVASSALPTGNAVAQAQTLSDALVRTYQVNPLLNAERARQRATDENVPQALSNYRPQLAFGASAGLIALRNILPQAADSSGSGDVADTSMSGTSQKALLKPRSFGLTINQTLFNGFKTGNQVRQAESQVKSGREQLRSVEQGAFLDAVTAYMGVLANQGLVEAQRANLDFLRETLGATKKRLDAGDVTPTDVAQADARYSRGVSDLNNAEVNLAIARATFVMVIGGPPGRLAPASPVDRLSPNRQDEALAVARRESPAIVQAMFDTDTAQYNIKIAESALYPTLGVQGNVSRQVQSDTTLGTTLTDQASIIGTLNVPIYDGGLAASQVRQAKEFVTQARILLDRARTQTDQAVIASWVTNEGSKIALSASESEVKASTLALQGVQREVQAGQRTTLDLLNSQQDLTLARSRLIGAQRDRVVASYTLLAAVGRLDHMQLKLQTPSYEPQTHYTQVRDVWGGLRTPSGQ